MNNFSSLVSKKCNRLYSNPFSSINLFKRNINSVNNTLVLGAHGCIGSSLSKDLNSKFGQDCIFRADIVNMPQQHQAFTFDAGDQQSLKSVIESNNIKTIVNLAGMNQTNSNNDFDYTMSNAISIADACLAACKDYGIKLIHVSSMDTLAQNAMIGNGDGLIEDYRGKGVDENDNGVQDLKSESKFILQNDILDKIYMNQYSEYDYCKNIKIIRVPKVIHEYNNEKLPYQDFSSDILISFVTNELLNFSFNQSSSVYDYQIHSNDLNDVIIDLIANKYSDRLDSVFINLKGTKIYASDLIQALTSMRKFKDAKIEFEEHKQDLEINKTSMLRKQLINAKDDVQQNPKIVDDLVKFDKLSQFTGGKMVVQQMEKMQGLKRKWNEIVGNNDQWRRWKYITI